MRDRRKADIWISAAGPISNLILVSIFLLVIKLFQSYQMAGGTILEPLQQMCVLGIFLNMTLAVFNLLPILLLDGSHILPHFLPPDLARSYDQIRPYGFIILLACLYLGVLGLVLSPFTQLIRFILLL